MFSLFHFWIGQNHITYGVLCSTQYWCCAAVGCMCDKRCLSFVCHKLPIEMRISHKLPFNTAEYAQSYAKKQPLAILQDTSFYLGSVFDKKIYQLTILQAYGRCFCTVFNIWIVFHMFFLYMIIFILYMIIFILICFY